MQGCERSDNESADQAEEQSCSRIDGGPGQSRPGQSSIEQGPSPGITLDAPPLVDGAEKEERGRARLFEKLVPLTGESAPPLVGRHLGRFRLLAQLGSGGMGEVYRAEDTADGRVVALKLLRPELVEQPEALRRFHKEARLLAELHSPQIANLIEVSEHDGRHFLVIEYVPGESLAALLRRTGPLPERQAIDIACEIATGLAVAHEQGIVHRDIKPENILLMARPVSEESSQAPVAPSCVKLTDFGLARHIVESESLHLTRTGAIVGTPLYMSPEQCLGRGPVDARTDVYALGATLYSMLAGRPPFVADSPMAVIALHCNDAPPPIEQFAPNVSAAMGQVLMKTLAKSPEARYATAAELLNDLERLRRGEPTSIVAHPRLPVCDPKRIVDFQWTWQLDAPPAELWPHVSNTERLNRAIGLQAPVFTSESEPGGRTRRIAKIRAKGIDITWQEHPFEWVEGRRFGVLREFSQGPFKWYTSVVELEPRMTGGTLLSHRIKIEPTGLIGRTVAAIELGVRSKRALDRVYRRIDAAVTGRLGNRTSVDPFEPPAELASDRREKLERGLDRLVSCGIDPAVVEQFGDFLAHGSDQEVARIRPLALAHRLSVPSDGMVAACLHGAREGLLAMFWDILCPICRIPSEVKETLRVIRQHAHCPSCNLDFEVDFATSVEMIFRADPEIRDSELGTYCIGGPAHSPHVAAQTRVAAGERIELILALPESIYRLRGPQLPFSVDLRVQPPAATGRLELDLGQRPGGSVAGSSVTRVLPTGSQVISLTNSRDIELLVRIERTISRGDALTAARAASLTLFRQLFPGEILAPGQLMNISTVTILVSELDDAARWYRDLGDSAAFGILHEMFRVSADCVTRHGGTVVKTVHEGIVAVFVNAVEGVRAAYELQPALESVTREELKLRVGVHRGLAIVATVNDQLDYFGMTVRTAWRLAQSGRPGQVHVSEELAADTDVSVELVSHSPPNHP